MQHRAGEGSYPEDGVPEEGVNLTARPLLIASRSVLERLRHLRETARAGMIGDGLEAEARLQEIDNELASLIADIIPLQV